MFDIHDLIFAYNLKGIPMKDFTVSATVISLNNEMLLGII